MMIGLALTPFFMMGLALTPCLTMVLALYPLFRIWFHVLQPKKFKTSQSQRGLCCTFEYYEVDGVLSYNALVAVLCGELVTVSSVGFLTNLPLPA
jgi:hypothetical protein